MFRKLLVFLGVLMIILLAALACGGYYAYQHRQEIGQKALNYAMQNMGKSFSLAPTKQAQSEDSFGLENILSVITNEQNSDVNNNEAILQMAQKALSVLGRNSEQILQATATETHDINARDKKGRTLLLNVCRTDASAQVIKMLLKYGADVSAVDNKGHTVLMYAAALNQNVEVNNLLIAAGANIKAQDNSGKTAADYAANEQIKSLLNQQ